MIRSMIRPMIRSMILTMILAMSQKVNQSRMTKMNPSRQKEKTIIMEIEAET